MKRRISVRVFRRLRRGEPAGRAGLRVLYAARWRAGSPTTHSRGGWKARRAALGVRFAAHCRAGPAALAPAPAVGKEGGVRLTVIDRGPRARRLPAGPRQDGKPFSLRPECGGSSHGQSGTSSRFSATIRRWMVYVAVPVIRQDGPSEARAASTVRGGVEPALAGAREASSLSPASVRRVSPVRASLSRTISSPLKRPCPGCRRVHSRVFRARLHLRRGTR